MSIQLNENTFAKKGKGQKGKTYTCKTFGQKVVGEDGKPIPGLSYQHLKNAREEEVRNVVKGLQLDVLDCILRGADVLIRQAAAGGGMMVEVLGRLNSENLYSSLPVDERITRIKALAVLILGTVRDLDKTLAEAYADVVAGAKRKEAKLKAAA